MQGHGGLAGQPTETPSYTGQVLNLTARLPRSHHNQLKEEAKRRGLRAGEFYVLVVDAFMRGDLARHPYLYAVTDDAVSVSVPAPSDFIDEVRARARERGVGANELIFTAVVQHLGGKL